MATWKSRGLRGSLLEDLINRTNEKYRETGLALIQKIPTPITPMQIDQESRHIRTTRKAPAGRSRRCRFHSRRHTDFRPWQSA